MTPFIVAWLVVVYIVAALVPGYWALALLLLTALLVGVWWVWAAWYLYEPYDSREE